VALCRADGVGIEAEMVRNGMALAFVRYTIGFRSLFVLAILRHKRRSPRSVRRSCRRRNDFLFAVSAVATDSVTAREAWYCGFCSARPHQIP
jgi:hypothetical protein